MRSIQWLPVGALLAASAMAWSAGCSDDSDTQTSTSTTTTSTSSGGGQGGEGGAGGEGGSGGQGGAMMVCNGTPTALNDGEPVTMPGTTDGQGDDFASFCGDTTSTSDAPDVVFTFTLPAEGTLRLTAAATAGSTLQPSLDVRTECEQAKFCAESQGGTATLGVAVPAGPIYVVVDGVPGTSGAFDLTALFTLPACGDGVVNPGEDCDPGAGAPGDACVDPGLTGECTYIPPPANQDMCPGEVINVSAGLTLLAADQGHFNYGYADDAAGSCAIEMGGADRVYQLVPAVSGTLTASIGYEEDGATSICDVNVADPGCWPRVLYARSTCADPASEIACALDPLQPMAPEEISIPVTAGTPVYLFVDGYDGQAYSHGPYNLIVDLQ